MMYDDDLPFDVFDIDADELRAAELALEEAIEAESPPLKALPTIGTRTRIYTDDPFAMQWRLQTFDPRAAAAQFRARHGDLPTTGFDASLISDQAARALLAMAHDSQDGERHLFCASATEVLALRALKAEMPNFTPVINLFADAALASHVTSTPMRLPPVLLVGPPGTGKTRACRRIADAVGIRMHRASAPTMSGAGALTGLDASWKTSRPGLIARAFLEGQGASPLFVIDEIDKPCPDVGGGDRLIDTLHDLLEPEGARVFTDDCIGLRMDVSASFWMATANDAGALRSSLLDRLHVISIPEPTRAEMMAVVAGIYAEARTGFGDWFSDVLHAGPQSMIAGLHPRAARRAVEMSMMSAIRRRDREVSEEDVQKAMKALETPGGKRFGFV